MDGKIWVRDFQSLSCGKQRLESFEFIIIGSGILVLQKKIK